MLKENSAFVEGKFRFCRRKSAFVEGNPWLFKVKMPHAAKSSVSILIKGKPLPAMLQTSHSLFYKFCSCPIPLSRPNYSFQFLKHLAIAKIQLIVRIQLPRPNHSFQLLNHIAIFKMLQKLHFPFPPTNHPGTRGGLPPPRGARFLFLTADSYS